MLLATSARLLCLSTPSACILASFPCLGVSSHSEPPLQTELRRHVPACDMRRSLEWNKLACTDVDSSICVSCFDVSSNDVTCVAEVELSGDPENAGGVQHASRICFPFPFLDA